MVGREILKMIKNHELIRCINGCFNIGAKIHAKKHL